ncbi:MAG: ribonuclease Z [Chloroflexi bacterium]|nr:ribonuclease Z [Chloroflexota bacterium]MBI5350292.1 ribonuclease Z [Chloroflexota bacterium]
MFEILFLGTSASAPSVHRGLSAQIVLHNEHRFLIDCGEGTQRQILQSGIGFKRLNRILITHAHLDHILGLAGLISTFTRWEAIDFIEIYAGKNALERIHDLVYGIVLRGAKPPMPIRFIPIQAGKLFDEKDFTVTAFPVQHRGADCFGFAFEEKSRRPFLNEKADALGVPFGPERSKLVKGEAVTLTNGTVITPEQVLGEIQIGTKFVFIGDAGRTNDLVDMCRDADGLVIESTYIEEEADIAKQFGHLTAKQAATLARDAGVKNLLLTHLSRRYRERNVRDEARTVFPNSTVARDFDFFQITRGKVERRQDKVFEEENDQAEAIRQIE